ncbi:MAG TPA: hypothetical protein VK772_00275 [Puia sp.]|nr:hypothetical protein [Puia sp.]
MRRLLTSLFFVLLIMAGLHAQNIEQPFRIGILFGPAFPVGKFASSGLDSSKIQSAAKTGINTTITLAYHFPNSIFGIYAIGSRQQNSVDNKALARTLTPDYPDTSSLVVNSKPWILWTFLVGPKIEFPLDASGKFSIEFNIGGGIQQAFVPDYTITQYYSNGSETGFYWGGSLYPAFCYQFGSGFNYHVNRHWSLVINASYTHSNSDHDYFEYGSTSYPKNFNFPISSLNLLAGISYSL